MDKVLEILLDIRPDVDFKNEDKLIDNGILDSFDIISIITELNQQFGISIKVNQINPGNLNSISNIWDLVCKLKADGRSQA